MATLTIEINIPDAQVDSILDAYKWQRGNDALTAAGVRDILKVEVIDVMKSTVASHKRHLDREARAAQAEPDIT